MLLSSQVVSHDFSPFVLIFFAQILFLCLSLLMETYLFNTILGGYGILVQLFKKQFKDNFDEQMCYLFYYCVIIICVNNKMTAC